MLHIVLVEPEIPPNTGNIIRLAANTGFRLHLIEPLGFRLEDAKMRRAGLDYHEFAKLQVYASLEAFMTQVKPHRVWAFSSKVTRLYTEAKFSMNDALLFGPETRGLSQTVLQHIPTEHQITLPMQAHSRSLNLSNAVAVAVYEAWRQLDFLGARVKNDHDIAKGGNMLLPLAHGYYKGLEKNLSEWNSAADEEAYRDV